MTPTVFPGSRSGANATHGGSGSTCQYLRRRQGAPQPDGPVIVFHAVVHELVDDDRREIRVECLGQRSGCA